jgi:hypothetical protein
MPTYCYRTEDGEIIDMAFSRGEAPSEVELSDGRKAVRDLRAELTGSVISVRGGGQSSRTWPMEPCIASGVHPDQAPELRAHFKKHGVSVDVPPHGDPIYESAGQRKKALKCRGMHDRNSFS